MATKPPKILTSLQCRAARAALKWTIGELSDRSGVGVNTILRFENDQGKPNVSTRVAVRYALEQAGIEFIENNGMISWGKTLDKVEENENVKEDK